jgi:hypothetical protein
MVFESGLSSGWEWMSGRVGFEPQRIPEMQKRNTNTSSLLSPVGVLFETEAVQHLILNLWPIKDICTLNCIMELNLIKLCMICNLPLIQEMRRLSSHMDGSFIRTMVMGWMNHILHITKCSV